MARSSSLHICCPACETVFRMPASEFPTAGRELRCSICGHEWHATGGDIVVQDDTPKEVACSTQKSGCKRKGRLLGWLCNLLLLGIIATIAGSYIMQRNYPFITQQNGNQLTIMNTSDTNKKMCGVYADTHKDGTLHAREWVEINQEFASGEERTVTLDNITNQTIISGNCMYLMLTGIWQKLESLWRK